MRIETVSPACRFDLIRNDGGRAWVPGELICPHESVGDPRDHAIHANVTGSGGGLSHADYDQVVAWIECGREPSTLPAFLAEVRCHLTAR